MNSLSRYSMALLRRIWWFCLSMVFYMMRVFPIASNKVCITNYFGKGYGDHGKYICKALLSQSDRLDIVWFVNNMDEKMPKGIRKVKYNSLRYIYELCTAKVWIDNSRKLLYVRKRKNQFYIQTWHGDIGNKKIEKEAAKALSPSYVQGSKNDSRMINLLISGNKWFTEKCKTIFWYDGAVEECGSPRRDILYNISAEDRRRIKQGLNIAENTKIVLYAPTFRKGKLEEELAAYQIDWPGVLAALKNRFGGEWTGMVRLHPVIAKVSDQLNYPAYIRDATNYPDMQELLAISDVCISDYSSSIFEFAVTQKPAFVFATDYEMYKKDRDVNFDFNSIPFSVAETNQELISNISSFDADRYAAMHDSFYHKRIGIYKEGHASEHIAGIILRQIGGQKAN